MKTLTNNNILTNSAKAELLNINQTDVLATELNFENHKSAFSAADLWSIQQSVRTAFSRRRLNRF